MPRSWQCRPPQHPRHIWPAHELHITQARALCTLTTLTPAHGRRYYKAETRGLDFDGFMEDVLAAPRGSLFLLHACAHNPTGVDPTPEQWAQLSKAMLERNHLPFFDMAYQGFASGDCDRDAAAIRIFLNDGHQMGCSQVRGRLWLRGLAGGVGAGTHTPAACVDMGLGSTNGMQPGTARSYGCAD